MKFLLATGLLLVSAFIAGAQSNARIERELIASFKEIRKNSAYGSTHNVQALAEANKAFAKRLVKYTKVSSTLSYDFKELGRYMHNATSEDGRLRIYSWDTEDRGTRRFYSRIYQYRGADGGVYSKMEPVVPLPEGDAGSFVTDIFDVEGKLGKIYIVCSISVASTIDHYQSAELYKITGKNLQDDVRLIRTRSGLTNNLGFEYNSFSVLAQKKRSAKLISYDKRTRVLRIPVVTVKADNMLGLGEITNRSIRYRFNGFYFVRA